uniref:FYVE-type zinc finger-containing protein C9B6.03 n=1 Tax=Talaromyces marneffei PM1 TaxID=1077442 RepID=A0A093XU60_TALMA
MATHAPFPAQTLANPGQISIYGHPSPTNSNTNTPANNSPTSPHLASATVLLPPQSRQIRPPKAPLYVPAVLRPTERPSRHQTSTTPTARDPSPITPPRSVHGSLDSLNEDPAPVEYKTKFHSRNNTVSKVAEDAWKKGERLGEVTGVPTRDHWKADSASQTCDSPTCRSSFGIFTRRHHCRHCGHVFCSSHTPYVVPLDQNARFHPEGSASRACDQCYKAYQRWEDCRAADMTRIQQKLDARHIHAQTQHEEQVDDSAEVPHRQTEFTVASSVPRDWNWSTF